MPKDSQIDNAHNIVRQDSSADELYSFDGVNRRLEKNKKELDEKVEQTKAEFKASKNENIAIFGIFASIVTFLSVQVSAFEKITSVSKLIGFSAFLLSVVLFMLAMIDHIIHKDIRLKLDITKYERFMRLLSDNKIIIIAIFVFVFSMFMFWYSVYGYNLW